MHNVKNIHLVTSQNDHRTALLRPILTRLNTEFKDIEASAIVTGDGLTIASVLSEKTDPDRFGAMCASLLALADRAAQEVARGRLKQVLVEGDNGTMLLVYCGHDMVLAVAANANANLGMVFLETRKTALKIQQSMA